MLREMNYPALHKAKQALVPIMRHTILVELESIRSKGHKSMKAMTNTPQSYPLSKEQTVKSLTGVD